MEGNIQRVAVDRIKELIDSWDLHELQEVNYYVKERMNLVKTKGESVLSKTVFSEFLNYREFVVLREMLSIALSTGYCDFSVTGEQMKLHLKLGLLKVQPNGLLWFENDEKYGFYCNGIQLVDSKVVNESLHAPTLIWHPFGSKNVEKLAFSDGEVQARLSIQEMFNAKHGKSSFGLYENFIKEFSTEKDVSKVCNTRFWCDKHVPQAVDDAPFSVKLLFSKAIDRFV